MSISETSIALLNNYFDKIFVVSIPRFTDRHKKVAENLQGLQFEFFWGADKQELDGEKLRKYYDEIRAKKLQRQGKGLNFGEIACSLSHRMVYKEMINKNLQKVLILEDDVIPRTDDLASLSQTLNELPSDWELVYLGYLKHETVTPALKRKQFFYKIISLFGMMAWSYKMVTNLLPRPYSTHLKKAGFHDCTHAYAITLAAANTLLAAQTPVVYRADDLLSATIMKGALNAYITDPKFFDQEIFNNAVIISEVRP